MTITINDELRAYIDPLTPDEYDALERSLLAEGCRDALVLWGDLLVDGHNRYAICTKHGLPYQTIQNERFTSLDDVHLWMIDNHLGRRSVSDFQRGILALRKKDIVLARARALEASVAVAAAEAPSEGNDTGEGSQQAAPPPVMASRESIAKAARVSSATIGQIEKIQREAAPELVQAVKAGEISINAAAAVATLPVDAQQAAVAGGRKELREAARLVREQKAAARPPKAPKEPKDGADTDATDGASGQLDPARLVEKVAELEAENAKLRRQVIGLTSALEAARREASES